MNKIIGIVIVTLLTITTVLPAIEIEENRYSDAVLMYEQLPDDSNYGIDIRVDRSDDIKRSLGDDFPCTLPGRVTQMTLFGSWKGDVEGVIEYFNLSFYENIDDPDGDGPEYSKPGKLLWSRDCYNFVGIQITNVINGEWWWDPYYDIKFPGGDEGIWKYDIYVDFTDAFLQSGHDTYWFVVYVILKETGEEAEFGLKTSYKHWQDDAVFKVDPNWDWYELRYPPGHDWVGYSIDLSFGVWTKETEFPPFIVDMTPGVSIFSVPALIINEGNESIPSGLEYKFTIDAPVMLSDKVSTKLTTQPIPPGSEIRINSGLVLGFGPADILVEVVFEEEVIADVEASGFVFGPIVYVQK